MAPAQPFRSAFPTARRDYGRVQPVIPVPDLIRVQQESFQWLIQEGIREVLREFSPIEDAAGGRFVMEFGDYEFEEPKHSEGECREKELTYARPFYVYVRLTVREGSDDLGEVREQRCYFGEFPWMTDRGTFIINGAERVVVSQLVRSPGAYFTLEVDPSTGRELCFGKVIPYRGAWLEFETSNRDLLYAKVDRKRKLLITTLLRAVGFADDEELYALLGDLDTHPEHRYLSTTLERESQELSDRWDLREEDLQNLWRRVWPHRPYSRERARRIAAAQLEIYRRLRPGEPPNLENASTLLEGLFFDPKRYDLGRVGRYKLNRRLGEHLRRVWEALHPGEPFLPEKMPRHLTPADLVAMVRVILQVNHGEERPDDIDHLGNRRVRTVGELVQNALRVGLMRMERVVRERMSTITEPREAAPRALLNTRPVEAAVREFFGSSQLSQFMDQTNPLAEVTHKRRLSALGPGGLSRERAGFEVRDVHHSHYGRVCPIETPEGPNIGLLTSMATYARLNAYGFLETPYRRVHHTLSSHDPDLVGRLLREDLAEEERLSSHDPALVGRVVLEPLVEPDTGVLLVGAGEAVTPEAFRALRAQPDREVRVRGRVLARAGERVTPEVFRALQAQPERPVAVRAFVRPDPADVVYLPADEEERYTIAQATEPLNEKGEFLRDQVEVRRGEEVATEPPERVDLMDVAPMQIVSVSTSLIPFLEHDDANRALMGSNMQRQAVPLVHPEAPLVATGMEAKVAQDSGHVLLSPVAGVVVRATAEEVVVRDDQGRDHPLPLRKYERTNQSTCLDQRPIVRSGQRVGVGTPLADSSSTDHGELALGQNVLVAFMCWEGYNFEDAVIISEDLVRQDRFTSIHIERYECEARTTKLGDEEITRDIPNVGEDALRDLDEDGIVRIGARVRPGDILVGKVSPKGETELTPEEKLLRAIFGEKARDVKDSSLRVPHGEGGKVIARRVLSRDGPDRDELPAGVKKVVRVWVAQTRKISVGDKVAGRHGNKGVISVILPVEDMPFLEDGTPVEMILNPIGVPSRMNLGQVMETHLGWVARHLGFRAVSPVFAGARDVHIEDGLARVWFLHRSGAVDARDLDHPRVDWERVRAWLAERGYDADRLFDDRVEGEARVACVRIWLQEEAGVDPTGMSYEEMVETARRLNRERRLAPPILGKMKLRDGRTGEEIDQPVTVGYLYMLKLIHLVEDKIHARSTGPYSLITQQPLGGKAQFGGQRFGEMEVWALEAYSAAYNLLEMLTIKSDDVVGRQRAYEAIIKGEDIEYSGVPESFQVLLKELQALGLSVELLSDGGDVAGSGETPFLTGDGEGAEPLL